MQYKIKLFKTPASIVDRQQQEYFNQLTRAVADLNNILANIDGRFVGLGSNSSDVNSMDATIRKLKSDISNLSTEVAGVIDTQESHTESIASLSHRVDVLEVEIS